MPYNVGSDVPLTIVETAKHVARHFTPVPKVVVGERNVPPGRIEHYIPGIGRAKEQLGLCVRVDLDDAIQRTISWHRERNRQTAEHTK